MGLEISSFHSWLLTVTCYLKNLQSEKGKEKDKTYINSFSKIVFIQDKWVILS